MKINKTKFLFVLASLSVSLLASCGENNNNVSSNEETPSSEKKEGETCEIKEAPTYNEDFFRIHYKRKGCSFNDKALWLWDKKLNNGAEYLFNGVDSFGAIASYKCSDIGTNLISNGMGFIVKSAGSWSSQTKDAFIDFSLFVKGEDKAYDIYLVEGDANIYMSPDLSQADEIKTCKFTSARKIEVIASNPVKSYSLKINGEEKASEAFSAPQTNFLLALPNGESASFEKDYSITVTFAKSGKELSKGVAKTSLYKTDSFKEDYTYVGQLGAIYSKTSTIFKVWSPVSSSITLRLYKNGTPKSVNPSKGDDTLFLEKEMVKGEKGVWSINIEQDLDGIYYTYFVKNPSFPLGSEVTDPYARATGINGKRGMVVNPSKVSPLNWGTFDKAYPYDRKELTVYELHIADLTASATWGGTSANSKKYVGFHEKGTKYKGDNGKEYATGFDHIKELGVNAIQILPMFDHDNDETKPVFNWGYNPVNYNVPEGVYSLDPYDGYTRINELKSLIGDYHEAGINVIMDVVYNHTSSVTGTNFDVLMPGYYFRYDADGALYNGSGCGNETASEMPMMQKFIVDSVTYWASEYKLGGFRFDLMGLHDLDTMKKVAEAVKPYNCTVYGEPWTGGTSGLSESLQAKQANGNKFEGYGAFNDGMRDALIKGGLNSTSAEGWITKKSASLSNADLSSLKDGILGSTNNNGVIISDPDKTTNYVTCHDNYTLYDRFQLNHVTDEDELKKMVTLANAIVFTSEGTTFMQGGEEFLRTKYGSGNSYNLDYRYNQFKYSGLQKNEGVFENYKKLIALKQNLDGLHMGKKELASNPVNVVINDGNEIVYEIKDFKNNKTYKIVHANGLGNKKTVDFEGYELYLDTLNSNVTLSKETPISSYQTIIAYK